jgi:hypothetical protein
MWIQSNPFIVVALRHPLILSPHLRQSFPKCYNISHLTLWIKPALACCCLYGVLTLSGITQSSATGWLPYQHVVSTRLLARGGGLVSDFEDWLIRMGRLSSAPACGDLTSSAHSPHCCHFSPLSTTIHSWHSRNTSDFVRCIASCFAKLRSLLSPCYSIVHSVTERNSMQT